MTTIDGKTVWTEEVMPFDCPIGVKFKDIMGKYLCVGVNSAGLYLGNSFVSYFDLCRRDVYYYETKDGGKWKPCYNK